MSDTTDNIYRIGDSITLLLKHKPFIDLSIPPDSNEYRDATCVNFAIYDDTSSETLITQGQMKKVPNKNGWYFYRYQIPDNINPGVYTVIFTSTTRIDGEDLISRSVQEFRVIGDGVL